MFPSPAQPEPNVLRFRSFRQNPSQAASPGAGLGNIQGRDSVALWSLAKVRHLSFVFAGHFSQFSTSYWHRTRLGLLRLSLGQLGSEQLQ